MALPSVYTLAPDFTLPDQNGTPHTLSKCRGKWVLVYFYPKDGTISCVAQACAIRDADPDFAKLDAIVFGVSADTVESHKKLAEKYGLAFPLLADEDKKVVREYGVLVQKNFLGRVYEDIDRTSFLVDPFGKIAKVYEHVKAAQHADMVLADLNAFYDRVHG
ncbi:MAG: peroxiredoxin, peroxiredoxin [Parcubacteria group bacterium]|nr:peroxiredoxin, peroxiredoxin [Parcubacteria group bacterium]